MVGGSYTNDNLDILAEEGRLVLISSMAGEHTDVKTLNYYEETSDYYRLDT